MQQAISMSWNKPKALAPRITGSSGHKIDSPRSPIPWRKPDTWWCLAGNYGKCKKKGATQ